MRVEAPIGCSGDFEELWGSRRSAGRDRVLESAASKFLPCVVALLKIFWGCGFFAEDGTEKLRNVIPAVSSPIVHRHRRRVPVLL
jgi:hypothetical protein